MAGPTQAAVIAAESALKQAEQKLDQLTNPSSADVIAARAAVDQARSVLAAKQNPYTTADITAQQNAVTQAQSALSLAAQPYVVSDRSSAEAAVAQAMVSLTQAQNNLVDGTLTAPFNGLVSAVALNAGEFASATSSLTILDPSKISVTVTVDESGIAKVQVGQTAKVTFDAIGARALNGKVASISPAGTTTSGVVGYPVTIAIRDAPSVLPGMTATVQIVTAQHDEVVTIPTRAITRSTVSVVTPTGIETRKVTTGLADDTKTEITSGLQAGEEVVVPATATRTSTGGQGGGAVPGLTGGPAVRG
jgi:RND family efflux transporter MFP subunit